MVPVWDPQVNIDWITVGIGNSRIKRFGANGAGNPGFCNIICDLGHCCGQMIWRSSVSHLSNSGDACIQSFYLELDRGMLSVVE